MADLDEEENQRKTRTSQAAANSSIVNNAAAEAKGRRTMNSISSAVDLSLLISGNGSATVDPLASIEDRRRRLNDRLKLLTKLDATCSKWREIVSEIHQLSKLTDS